MGVVSSVSGVRLRAESGQSLVVLGVVYKSSLALGFCWWCEGRRARSEEKYGGCTDTHGRTVPEIHSAEDDHPVAWRGRWGDVTVQGRPLDAAVSVSPSGEEASVSLSRGVCGEAVRLG